MSSVCAVVPVYDHERTVGTTVGALRGQGLTVFLVDDGSGPDCETELRRLAEVDPQVRLLRLPVNQGKGAAVMAGFASAMSAGFTHAVQVDADGQHDIADVAKFVAVALSDPQALVCGRPVFDESIPRNRLYLRYLTHAMVWVNTLSFDIPDAMCGLRVYPLSVIMPLFVAEPPGRRMDFDVEVLVRLNWYGVAMRWLPTRVRYPADGVSHFRLVRDNWLITKMHTRLFFGMLRRAPRLLARSLRAPSGVARGIT
jgi:glycosyltransferase involved in cell wall biosynthesis